MRRRLHEWLCSAAVWAVASVLALVGAAFLVVAGYLALRTVFPPALSALVTGAGALVIAGAVVLVARAALRRRRPPPKPVPSRGLERELALLLGRGLAGWISEHPGGATAGAFVTGLVSGMSPTARRALVDVLRDGARLLTDLASTAAEDDD